MSKPANTTPMPVGCPRARDGGYGPRACALQSCRFHLRGGTNRGPLPSPARVRLAVLNDDACALDVEACAKRARVVVSFEAVGSLMGISRQAAQQAFKSARKKILKAIAANKSTFERCDLKAG